MLNSLESKGSLNVNESVYCTSQHRGRIHSRQRGITTWKSAGKVFRIFLMVNMTGCHVGILHAGIWQVLARTRSLGSLLLQASQPHSMILQVAPDALVDRYLQEVLSHLCHGYADVSNQATYNDCVRALFWY